MSAFEGFHIPLHFAYMLLEAIHLFPEIQCCAYFVINLYGLPCTAKVEIT